MIALSVYVKQGRQWEVTVYYSQIQYQPRVDAPIQCTYKYNDC